MTDQFRMFLEVGFTVLNDGLECGSKRRRAMGGTRVLVARGVDADAINACGASAEQHQLRADRSLGNVEVTLGRLHLSFSGGAF